MEATLTKPRPRAGGPSRPDTRVWAEKITGRYRPITTHQLAMVWWLYRAKHITRAQFRIYFAAHEMREKRNYTKTDPDTGKPRRPLYTLEEVRRFTGSQATDADLSADVKALGRLGLVMIGSRSIEFAVSFDQINPPPPEESKTRSCPEAVGGFWTFFRALPNTRRTVPVPRRTCRMLAKGLSRGESGMVVAILIRCLFWHRDGGAEGQGGYRVDGRTKCSWIAEVFGLSRRTVTDARASLIECGWMSPVDCPQWQLNKWGQRYVLNVEEQGGSASLFSDLPDVSASPCLNKSTSLSKREDLKTRKPDPARSDFRSVGSRKEKVRPVPAPRLSNVRGEDLRDTGRLFELYRQAIDAGHPVKGEKGRLEFFALAERAREHGLDAPRLFAWLLRERRFDFITHAEEDQAIARIKRWQRPREQGRTVSSIPQYQTQATFLGSLSADERFVHACLQVGRERRVDPFRIAQAQGWSRQRWDETRLSYDLAERRRWKGGDASAEGYVHLEDSDT